MSWDVMGWIGRVWWHDMKLIGMGYNVTGWDQIEYDKLRWASKGWDVLTRDGKGWKNGRKEMERNGKLKL